MAKRSSDGSASTNPISAEVKAIDTVYHALRGLDSSARARVVEYVSGMLDFSVASRSAYDYANQHLTSGSTKTPEAANSPTINSASGELSEGINALAQKWMKRSSLNVEQLSAIFSIGGDEIDLIAKKIPGASKKMRVRSVLLLKAIAQYMSTGAARVPFEQIKETCLHYDAYDATNFATYLKSLASEVSGSKQAGYTLTAKGMAAATELIADMIAGKASS